MLTIFYDGQCPLCCREMDALRKYDQNNKLRLVDLHIDEFKEQYPNIDVQAAMTVLHAYDDGQLLKGLDVTAAAWKAVGRQRWTQALRWPGIRWIADLVYVFFANNRYRLSWLLTGQDRCNTGQCAVRPPMQKATLKALHQDESGAS